MGVIPGLFLYIYMDNGIVGLIGGNETKEYYLSSCLMILLMFVIREIASGISTLIFHTATFNALGDIRNEISQKLFKMPLGVIMYRSSGELKNIMVEQVESMETSLAHLVPEVTATDTLSIFNDMQFPAF